jgi:hypothetical protein
MTAGITKRPAFTLEALGRGVVYAVLGVVFAVGSWGLASGPGRPTIEAQQNAPAVVELRGTGSDTTSAFDVEKRRLHLVAWTATCPVTVELIPWKDEDAGTAIPLVNGQRRMLDAGGYFFFVDGACDWVVRVSPT